MNKDAAIEIAKTHIADQLQVCIYDERPSDCVGYSIDANDVFWIRIVNDRLMVGGSRFLTVSKADGFVRDLGWSGE